MTSFHSARLRLTPSQSPFFRSPTPRSPTNASRDEPGLHLKKVIGTTTASSNTFGFLSAPAKFAFTAGAAAVIATVSEDLGVTQEFFRATPGTANAPRDPLGAWPLTPTPNEARHRPRGNARDSASPTAFSPRDWSDSPTGRTSSAKDRVKAATSVALSPDGRWLAVGETGYRPRVLIFSARDGSSETPACALSEHTFGVHALAFSPDSRYLASLGTVNDGFLYVWSIDERSGWGRLHASNKCTTLIYSMTWMGRSIVTVGLRAVRVWRAEDDALDVREGDRNAPSTPRHKHDSKPADFGNSILSPKHRVLAGKNCLLGELLEAVFISVVAISSSKALVCAESGHICLLDDRDRVQALTLVAHAGIRISAARLDGQCMFHVVGEEAQTASYLVPDLERRGAAKTPRGPCDSPAKASHRVRRSPCTIAIATVGAALVEMRSDRVISLSQADSGPRTSGTYPPRRLAAHQDAVLGVQAVCSPTLHGTSFLTYSADGTVRFWDGHGNATIDLVQMPVGVSNELGGLPNETRAVAVLTCGTFIVSGDKYGIIALVDIRSRQLAHHVRAHTAEVTALLAFEINHVHFVASASRDRTVQLFVCANGKLDLLQTMDEHAGAVTGLLMSPNSSRLLSCSADRSIVVRECIQRGAQNVAFAMVRAITLKSAPTSMCNMAHDTILVSTVDRSIAKHNITGGQAGFSFKCGDNDGGDAVAMSKILFAPSLNGNPTIVGVSSSDKSIRLYSDYGTLIARDWGHTEGITDLALVAPDARSHMHLQSPHIVTVAADSTIFLWQSTIVASAPSKPTSDDAHGISISGPLAPPLRKVISHSELSRIRRGRMVDEKVPPSASAPRAPHAASPPKVRKKASRPSLAQSARQEAGFGPHCDPCRRSPSPLGSKHTSQSGARGSQLGMSLRSKSSENVLSTSGSAASTKAFGTLNASTESVCRTLRAYRRKLGSAAAHDGINAETLRELDRELKLTARTLGERWFSKHVDEATVARLLDQVSDKMVGLLDQKIKDRVESEVRRTGELSSPASSQTPDPRAESDEGPEAHVGRSDAAPRAQRQA